MKASSKNNLLKNNKKDLPQAAIEINANPINETNTTKNTKANWPWLVLAITALVHFIGVNNGFVNWDDEAYIHRNELIKTLNFESIKKMFDPASIYGGNYHPLVALSNAIEYNFTGLNPKLYHFVNLILHLINTFLVFVFCKKMSNGNVIIASTVALFFGIHPMHVESVAWISERKDVLYACFYLGSLIAYVNYKQKLQNKYLLYSILFFVLSLLSKSMAVTLPLILIAIDFYLDGKIIITNQLNKIIFFGLSLLFGLLAMNTQAKQGYIGAYDFSILDKFFISCYSTCYYIIKLFLPIQLSTLHPFPKVDLPILYYLSPLLIIAIVALIFRIKQYSRLLIFGCLFYLFSISIVMQFITVGAAVVCERYTYMSYIGLFFILATIAHDIYKGKIAQLLFAQKLIKPIGVIAILCFAYMSYAQTLVWKDGESLWRQATLRHPQTADYAWFGLANILKEKKGDPKEIMEAFDKATAINPNFPNYYLNSAAAKSEFGFIQEAMNEYNKALNLNPNYDLALYNRGILYNNSKNYEAAIADYTKALAINKNYIQARFNRAISYKGLKNYPLAIADYKEVLRQDANFLSAYTNLGNIYFDTQNYTEAINSYNACIARDPNIASNYLYRGICQLNLNNKTQGCADLQKAVSLGSKEAEGALLNFCK